VNAPRSGATDVWTRIDDTSSVGDVRRNATRLAERLGFDQHRTGEVAIAATELATNAQVHGAASSVLLRAGEGAAESVIEIVVIDSGPGVTDVPAMMEDGVSTRGTLGIGLGAIRRIANRFEMYSVPHEGTIMVAAFAGESACGDSWAWHATDEMVAIVVADGLGHGVLAAEASQAAIAEFNADPLRRPDALLQGIHNTVAGTRGAAVSAVRFDRHQHVLEFCGVGNVSCRIIDDERATNLPPQPGIVGQHLRTVRQQAVTLVDHAVVVLHSDGLTSKWDLGGLPGIRVQSSTVIAAALLRSAGVRHDDASVAVLRVS
jgi:anti-sigma regulatory factor (Ser/Thr protein kinase)